MERFGFPLQVNLALTPQALPITLSATLRYLNQGTLFLSVGAWPCSRSAVAGQFARRDFLDPSESFRLNSYANGRG